MAALEALLRLCGAGPLDDAQEAYLAGILADYEARAGRMSAADVAEAQEELWDVLQGQLPDVGDVRAADVAAWFADHLAAVAAASATAAQLSRTASGGAAAVTADATDARSSASGELTNPTLAALMDVFPAAPRSHIEAALVRYDGEIDGAVRWLLDHPTADGSPGASSENVLRRTPSAVDEEIKRRIVETYMMREVKLVNGEEATARPVLRVTDEKKNVRYRDNKVVTTRGERQIVEKDEEAEAAMKKTFVNLRPLRQYRFH